MRRRSGNSLVDLLHPFSSLHNIAAFYICVTLSLCFGRESPAKSYMSPVASALCWEDGARPPGRKVSTRLAPLWFSRFSSSSREIAVLGRSTVDGNVREIVLGNGQLVLTKKDDECNPPTCYPSLEEVEVLILLVCLSDYFAHHALLLGHREIDLAIDVWTCFLCLVYILHCLQRIDSASKKAVSIVLQSLERVSLSSRGIWILSFSGLT